MFSIPFLITSFISLGQILAETCDESIMVKGVTKEISSSLGRKQKNDNEKPCAIKITTDEPYKLKIDLTITQPSALVINDKCVDEDFVTVGNSETAQSDKLCKKDGTLQFDSTGSSALVMYKVTPISDEGQLKKAWSFKGLIKSVNPKAACGDFVTVFDGTPTEFKFPMGNVMVEVPTTCEYTIKNTNGINIRAVLKDLKLYDSVNCETDYLALSSGNAVVEEKALKICKMTQPPPNYVTEGPELAFKIMVTNYNITPLVKLSIESGTSESLTTPSAASFIVLVLKEIHMVTVLCTFAFPYL